MLTVYEKTVTGGMNKR